MFSIVFYSPIYVHQTFFNLQILLYDIFYSYVLFFLLFNGAILKYFKTWGKNIN